MFFKSLTIVLLVVLLAAFSANARQIDVSQMTEEQLVAYAKRIHDRALTLDTHVDIPGGSYATPARDPGSEDYRAKCTLPKMEKGGLDGVFLAVFVGQGALDEEGYRNAYQSAMGKFDAVHRLTGFMYPERCELAVTPDEVERIAKTGKRVIMIGIENGYPIGMDLSNVEWFYKLGARYITLSHSGHSQICDSSGPREPLHNGLSEFGKQVVAEMNRLGIMVDVSHIADKSFWDVIELSKAPIIASHSGCRALTDVGRNLTDDQLRALAKNGGVIQIVALAGYLRKVTPGRDEAIEALNQEFNLPTGRAAQRALRELTEEKLAEYNAKMEAINEKYPQAPTDVKVYVDHIDHAVKVAGINHVGIGTDFDGGGGVPGFNDHSESLNVTVELVRRGYSEEDIMKIWGGNLLRVWREVEKVAAELQKGV